MSNWGRRDREPPAEETELPAEGTNESQAETHDTQEPAPAFWRAQGEMSGRDPADATPPAVAVAREPAVDEAQEPAVTEPPGEAQEPPMTEAEQPAVSAVTPQRWSGILVAFVDDPRGSVKMAADAVDEAIDEFVNSVRARQHDLAATWQGAGADTEQLRTALREYRKLGRRVQQLDLGEKTGG